MMFEIHLTKPTLSIVLVSCNKCVIGMQCDCCMTTGVCSQMEPAYLRVSGHKVNESMLLLVFVSAYEHPAHNPKIFLVRRV